jgi:hypothetical protein
VVGIHEGAELSQAGGEVREGIDAEPGQQEAGADKGLQKQAQIPTGVVRPGGMRGSGAALQACDRLVVKRKGRGLETDEQIGAHDEFPPAGDALGVGQAIIRPAQFVLGLLEPVLGSYVRSPKVWLTLRSILPGKLVMRSHVVSDGRWSGSIVISK